jgi:hypothetical protein
MQTIRSINVTTGEETITQVPFTSEQVALQQQEAAAVAAQQAVLAKRATLETKLGVSLAELRLLLNSV